MLCQIKDCLNSAVEPYNKYGLCKPCNDKYELIKDMTPEEIKMLNQKLSY